MNYITSDKGWLHLMSSHHSMSVDPPAAAPALFVALALFPSFVILALAVILNWGR